MKALTYCLAAIAAASHLTAHAKQHQFITLPDTHNATSVHARAQSSEDVVVAFLDANQELNVDRYRRGADGFVRIARADNNLDVLDGAVGSWQITGMQTDTDNTYVTVASENSEFLIRLGTNGLIAQHTVLPSSTCDGISQLLRLIQGVGVYAGCGEIDWFNNNLNLTSTVNVPTIEGSEFAFATPWIIPGDNETDATITENYWWFGSRTDQQWEAVKLDLSGDIADQFSLDLPDNLSACQWLTSSDNSPSIVCVTADGESVIFSPGGNTTLGKPYLASEALDVELSVSVPGSGFTVGEHVMVAQSVTATESEKTLRISNHKRTQGSLFATHSTILVDEENVTLYTFDPSGYMGVSTLHDGQQWQLSLYDHLPRRFGPQFLQGWAGSIGSEQELNIPLVYQDEHVVRDQIQVKTVGGPDWVSIHPNPLPAFMLWEPSHEDVGDVSLTLSLNNGIDPVNLSAHDVRVLLSDYQVTLFESTWFARLGIEEAFPVRALANQILTLQTLEDEYVLAQIGLVGRPSEAITLSWSSLPGFLLWDENTMTLSGTPEQKDVGNYPEITLTVRDDFAETDPQTGEKEIRVLVIPIEVVEVDEAPAVLSDGTDSLTVGEQYSYGMSIEDEESALSDLNIELAVGPGWLQLNEETATLSGRAEGTGVSRVQVIIRDEGGNTIVHTFSLTVNGETDESRSGGAIPLGALWVLLTIVSLRRRRPI